MSNFNTPYTNPQFQETYPNPNFDQLFTQTTTPHELSDSLNFRDISNYLMSDEDFEGDHALTQTTQSVYESIMNFSDEISNSVPSLAQNGKCRRDHQVEKYYKAHDGFRFAFKTKSIADFMDDGFKWRKYGKKMVKSSPYPRNYFKCSSGGCSVKKRVERDGEDPSYVITTYQGMHNHHTPTNCHVVYGTPHKSSSQLSHTPYLSCD